MDIETTTATRLSTDAPGAGWRAILRRATPAEFAAAFRADVVLEATLFDGAAIGPAALQTFFNATRDLYETIGFVDETRAGTRTVLAWEGIAFGGQAVTGVTILDHDTDGAIARVRLFHRPYSMVLACAATLAHTLGDQLGPGVRWRAPAGFHPMP